MRLTAQVTCDLPSCDYSVSPRELRLPAEGVEVFDRTGMSDSKYRAPETLWFCGWQHVAEYAEQEHMRSAFGIEGPHE